MISKGNPVKFARFALLAVSCEEAKTFFFVQCILKQLLDSVFVISRIIKVEVRVISPYSGYHKTSSNNCLVFASRQLLTCVTQAQSVISEGMIRQKDLISNYDFSFE